VAIGGDRGTSYAAAKEVLIHDFGSDNSDLNLQTLEERITSEANQLGIGPMGFGGRTTVLGTKIAALHRLPASYFVSVSYNCWAIRHRRMVLDNDEVRYE
jgi:fumarate hydratase class I